MGEELEIRTVEERPFWETINCKDIESIVLGNIYTQERATKTLINSAVAAGYYLRRQRDEKMYLEQGYDRFEDYVKDRYGKSLSWASRQIDMNEAFSIGGNDPRADEKWLEFGKSQLQEMLYLTDKQREQVTPGMTVKEIREIRKPEPVSEPELAEEAPVEVVICETVDLKPEIVYEPAVVDAAPTETVIVESSVEEMLPDVDEGACGPAKCITGQSGSGLCGGAAYCSEPYTCCAQCSNDCNGRCGWLDKPEKVDPVVEEVATSQVAETPSGQGWTACIYDDVIVSICPADIAACKAVHHVCCEDCMDATCEIRCEHAKKPKHMEPATEDDEEAVVDCEASCMPEITPQKLLREEKEKLEQWLEAFKDDSEVPEFIAKQKIIVGALAGMVCDLEEAEYVEPDQPELPIMRNNDQRKAFLDDYRSWPVWFRVQQADEVYYRYDFEDGTAFVIRETKYFNEWRIRYNEDPEGIHTQEYILKPDYHYLSNCRSNRSEMIEYLRLMQKGR